MSGIRYAAAFNFLEHNAQLHLWNVFVGGALVPVVEMTPNGVEEALSVLIMARSVIEAGRSHN
jgi:hypothetical protein